MVEDSLSPLSAFIANAHSELYAFYTGKGNLLKTCEYNQGGEIAALTDAPLIPPLATTTMLKKSSIQVHFVFQV